MVFFSLTKITPAAPNDPLVNEVTQLNNNWDTINDRLDKMQGNSTEITDIYNNPGTYGIQTGHEIVKDYTFYVYTGSVWRAPTDFEESWSAWTQVPLSANVVNRTGFPLQYRTNPDLRCGELTGMLQKDAGGNAFSNNVGVVASNAVSQPIASFTPVAETRVMVGCNPPNTPATEVAVARANITATNGWQLSVTYRGNVGAAGANYISLDGVRWWY